MRFLSVKVSASERSELVNPPENTSQSDDKVPGREEKGGEGGDGGGGVK